MVWYFGEKIGVVLPELFGRLSVAPVLKSMALVCECSGILQVLCLFATSLHTNKCIEFLVCTLHYRLSGKFVPVDLKLSGGMMHRRVLIRKWERSKQVYLLRR